MYFKLFSQASIEVIVSFEESGHCFGAHSVWSHLAYSLRITVLLLIEAAKIEEHFDVLFSVGSLKILRCHQANELNQTSKEK